MSLYSTSDVIYKKMAFSGVNYKVIVNTMFSFAPPEKQKANIDLSLILDKIPLLSKILLKSKSCLTNLYIKQNLPMREIAR
jgi:hypothetical protein